MNIILIINFDAVISQLEFLLLLNSLNLFTLANVKIDIWYVVSINYSKKVAE